MLKLDGKTQDLISENITKLKDLFPEAFKEGRIDFEALRLILGDEIDTENERYSFTWHGKSEAIKLALKQSTGTLRPCKEESKHWDTTQNLFIEGDNLEVLRILQSSYRNKIKMIYIDPPYNTGNDFIYEDDFKDNVKHYKEKVSEAMKANPETAGRYHTNWLNMMYPRLKLARNLLRDDGVIFISIDDNEVHNLRKICDDIFGGG
jgi:adenine-specific DNA-methyltransferase